MQTEPTEKIQTNAALGESGRVHIYLPSTTPGCLWPFVIAIHGGGWHQGDQSSYAFLPPKLCPLGIATVLVSYRKAPEFRFPAAYDDLVHVLEWLAVHGGEHGLDVGRSMLFGSSAGGHLAMLLATRATAENRLRPVLRGVAECCGIMDLTAQFSWDSARDATMTRDFLQASPSEAPELYRLASPMEHVHRNMPPAWISHGDADTVVLIEQSRRMVARLRDAGLNPAFYENPGVAHALVLGDPPRLVFEDELLAFIRGGLEC